MTDTLLSLSVLGPRICILGPSNSGKSTLADAIGRKAGLQVVHLDQLHHMPGTHWMPRPTEEFHALHDGAIMQDHWVIEGNYSSCMPSRFARASGVILLDVSTARSLGRYLRRTWFERGRIGGLENAGERVTWEMIRYIAFSSSGKRKNYAALVERLMLPCVFASSSAAIHRLYTAWSLERR